jgi:hypothetical protein
LGGGERKRLKLMFPARLRSVGCDGNQTTTPSMPTHLDVVMARLTNLQNKSYYVVKLNPLELIEEVSNFRDVWLLYIEYTSSVELLVVVFVTEPWMNETK